MDIAVSKIIMFQEKALGTVLIININMHVISFLLNSTTTRGE